MNRPMPRRLLATAALSLPLGLPACTTPEDSPLYHVDWDKELAAARRDEPALPDAPEPRRFDGTDPFADAALPSDGPVELSLEQATFLALRHNRDLAVQQFNPVITGTFEKLERGVFDPELFAEFEYSQETATEVDRGTGQQFSVDSNDTAALAGVRQDLPTGTNVELSVGQDREASNRAPEQQDARVGLTVTQQLLRGAGPAVNLARIRQAQIDTRASLYELRGFTETLLADVETTYWQYALSLKNIEIFQESLDLSKRQLDEVEQRIEVGVLAETEAAVARAEVALREQALIDARSALETNRLQLLRLVNPSGVSSLSRPLTLTSKPSLDTAPLDDLEDRVRLAELARPDLAEARLRLEQDRLETIVTRNGVLPRLEVFINLGKTGFADTFSDSFRELDGDTYDLAAGVGLSQSLGNDAATAENQAAYATRRQSAAAVENLKQLVQLDVRLAANELERARQQIAASRTTRELQEDAVRAERERFDVGSSTALLVAQAQRDLLEAQINEVQAVVAYRLALIDLYVAEGSLLDRRGYRVD